MDEPDPLDISAPDCSLWRHCGNKFCTVDYQAGNNRSGNDDAGIERSMDKLSGDPKRS
jgi:hypothetical protein